MSDHPNRAERRGHSFPEEPFGPAPFIYTRDPWDERRFSRFARWRSPRTSGWEAAAPFLLIAGRAGLLALTVWLVNVFVR
jgi:hypothetical protein